MKLSFDNRTLEKLPVEKSMDYLIQRQIHAACFSLVEPTPIEAPKLVSYRQGILIIILMFFLRGRKVFEPLESKDALSAIGLDLTDDVYDDKEFVELFAGNEKFDGAKYAAHCYCGHQFGAFAGQLGDGATMYIGEVVHKDKRTEIQFKGAGKTPFSRSADGRKVLRSSVREYLCSEAMAALNIPTTRAGTLVTSFETRVARDKFYDGHPTMEPTAVITRLAETFIRFGSFEIAKMPDRQTGRAGPSAGNTKIVNDLLDYTIESYYPEIEDSAEKYTQFLGEITERTARLAAKWQLVGFCHGVLNTDNMSIVGLTIDYGPFGFMDRFDPGFICNASDAQGRYKYENQPIICKWNLMKFAQQIHFCLGFASVNETAEFITEKYDKAYVEAITAGAREKLGLQVQDEGDMALYETMLTTMAETAADFTATWRALELIKTDQNKKVTKESKESFLNHVVR